MLKHHALANFVLANRGIVFILSIFLLSLVFMLAPKRGSFTSILYVHSKALIGTSCISLMQWTWMLTGSILLLTIPNFFSRSVSPSVAMTESLHHKSVRTIKIQAAIEGQRLLYLILTVNVIWFLAAVLPSSNELFNNRISFWEIIGAKAAWPALWNLAFTVFPVQRTSKLLDHLGISRDCAVKIHTYTSKAIILWTALHTFVLSLVYAIKTKSLFEWFTLMVPNRHGLYTEGVVNFMGWIALFFLLLVWYTSRESFRKTNFEQFLASHATSLLFVFFANLHDYNTLHFVQPAFVSWTSDLLLRWYARRIILQPHLPSQQQHSDGILKVSYSTQSTEIVDLTFDLPGSWPLPCPGTHLYLSVPSLSRWQAHPISISAVDRHNRKIQVHVKALGEWTTEFVRLMQHAVPIATQQDSGSQQQLPLERDGLDTSISIVLEGPYGTDLCRTLETYDHCLLIAGGVGLTGLSETAYMRQHSGKYLHIVWIVKTFSDLHGLSALLNRIETSSSTRVQVFVTQHQDLSRKKDNNFRHTFDDRRERTALICVDCLPYDKSIISDRLMLLTGILGMIASFVIARFLCCSRSIRVHGDYANKCSVMAGYSSSTYRFCRDGKKSEEDSLSMLKCCTVPICFYCFRGLPILLTFFLGPAFALLPAMTIRNIQFSFCYTRFPSFSGMQYCSMYRRESFNPLNTSDAESNLRTDGHIDATSSTVCGSFPIECRRPVLSEILNSFLMSSTENVDDTLAPSTRAVAVCGSPLLVSSVLSTIDDYHRLCTRKKVRLHAFTQSG